MRKTETLDKQTQRKSFCPSVEGFLKNALMQVQLTKWSVTETIFFFLFGEVHWSLPSKRRTLPKKKVGGPAVNTLVLKSGLVPGLRTGLSVYISYWNQTLQHSQKLSFYYTFKKNYSLSAYLDLTRKNPSRKSLVTLRISSINFGLKQVDTTKYLVMRDYVVSAIVTKLKMKLIFY